MPTFRISKGIHCWTLLLLTISLMKMEAAKANCIRSTITTSSKIFSHLLSLPKVRLSEWTSQKIFWTLPPFFSKLITHSAKPYRVRIDRSASSREKFVNIEFQRTSCSTQKSQTWINWCNHLIAAHPRSSPLSDWGTLRSPSTSWLKTLTRHFQC